MTAEELLKNEGIFHSTEVIGNIPCSIGYKKEFRWSWLATQLNTFVFIGETTVPVDRSVIESFSTACKEYAVKNNKGWPRGIQSGIGSIAILKAEKIDNGAIAFCESLSKKHWCVFEIPVLYDTLQKKTLRYRSNPLWGRIYFPYFSKFIDTVTGKF